MSDVDIELLLVSELRDDPGVAAIVGQRIHTEILPETPTFPLLRITLLGAAPADRTSATGWLIRNSVQFDAYATDRATARNLAGALKSALVSLNGEYLDGVITGVELGALRALSDSDHKPPLPRYILTATIYAHPALDS